MLVASAPVFDIMSLFAPMFKMLFYVFIFGVVVIFFRDIIPAIFKKQKQAKWFEAQRTISDIQRLKPKEFEQFIAFIFGKMGFSAKTTKYIKDGGIDVIAVKDGRTHFIQCKKYTRNKVTLAHVRDFYGAMADAGCNRGFFVTTSFFTLDAEQFAAGKPIELIDGERLMEYVRKSSIDLAAVPPRPETVAVSDMAPPSAPQPQQQSEKELCPKCGAQLVIRTAGRGAKIGSQFLGCSAFPECRFTVNFVEPKPPA